MSWMVFVVRRDREDLFEALKSTVGKEPSVRVVLDRRTPEDDATPATGAAKDRRARDYVDEELRHAGWSVVRV